MRILAQCTICAVSATKSCFVQKLSHYIDLSSSDEELLAKLEDSEREYGEDQVIHRSGEELDYLFVVKSGWSYSSAMLVNGRRQVIQVHYPGDIIGLSCLPFDRALYDLDTSTDCVLCPFPKEHLDAILTRSPRVTALLFTLAAVEQAVLFDRLRAVARMSARDRLCHFLLEIHARLVITGGNQRYRLPLTQAVIGDALGLTNVSVSRAMTEIEREGLITRHGREMELTDLDRLREMAEFQDRFGSVKTTWFPE